MEDNDKLYTTEEVAARYRVCPKTVTRWVLDGRLGAIKLGVPRGRGEYRFKNSDLEDFEVRCREGGCRHGEQNQRAAAET